MSNVETKQHQQPGDQAYSKPEPRLKNGARRTKPGHHGHCKQQSTGESAHVSHVVDVQARMQKHIPAAD